MSSSYPLIGTKIHTPRRRPSLLRRQRLVDYCHENIHHKLVLVSAAAGYGKTTLLIDFAMDTDLPICWYSLDTHDAHVPTFVEYLVASIHQRFPEFGQATLSMLRAYSGPPEDVEPFVRQLIDEIERTVSRYFVIVLDDYHEISDSEPVNALVDGLLRYLPEQCHLLLASRGIPHRLTLTRLAARQEVAGLGAEHLRFTADEIYELFHKLDQADLTREQAQLLAERSEGWITGILLAAQTGWTGATGDVMKLSGASGGVFDYLADEVLDLQSSDTRRFLLGSSLFEAMSPPLCDALLEIDNSAQLLVNLATQNLFTHPLDAEGQWYQYHQLFRQFLRAKFERDDPQGYRRLCLKQAGLMAQRGNYTQAIDSYVQAQAYDRAADALEVVCSDAFDSGNWGALRGWVEVLPEPVLDAHPRILLFGAKVLTETGSLNLAGSYLERAYNCYLARQDDQGAARVLMQTAVVQRFRGRLSDAIETCRLAMRTAPNSDVLTSTLAHHNLGICQTLLGEVEGGVGEMMEALRLAESNADDINAAYIAHDLGTAELQRGRLVTARQSYHRALMYWRKLGNASALASTLESLGVVHHHLGQYAESENRLQEGLAKAQQARDVRVEAYTIASLGDLYRDTCRPGEALATYENAMDIAARAQLSSLVIYLLDAMGNTHRLKGEWTLARQVLTEATDQARATEMVCERGLCELSMGALELQLGHLTDAGEHLAEARDLLVRAASRRDVGRAHLCLAALALARSDDDGACRDLEYAAHIADDLGSHQFLVAEGGAFPSLLKFAEQQSVAGLDWARIRVEIQQLGHEGVVDVAKADARAGKIEFLALDGGQVLKDGRLVTDWESTAARIMAFLFACHPRGIARDRVIGLLWPDVSQAKGNGLFHSTMYRIRRALGRSFIIHEGGVYSVNPGAACRSDLDEFRQLTILGRENDAGAAIARMQAIELYRSPFLETCDGEWCQEIRQELDIQMLELVLHEALWCAEQGASDRAEDLYSRALALDSYNERALRGVMWCRAHQNDRAGAVRRFRESARVFREELDVVPSPETLQLYEAITSGTPLPLPG